jgi:hypothetical protein
MCSDFNRITNADFATFLITSCSYIQNTFIQPCKQLEPKFSKPAKKLLSAADTASTNLGVSEKIVELLSTAA